jgi:D-beta-D-heptose 7-phosphate kinase/D-beta-D-heptose 1-phosphate adenosyltransferase
VLIRALRPDVLVKGADYEPSRIVGAAEVEGWGGRVVRIPSSHTAPRRISSAASAVSHESHRNS